LRTPDFLFATNALRVATRSLTMSAPRRPHAVADARRGRRLRVNPGSSRQDFVASLGVAFRGCFPAGGLTA
jgi:hypothetical protein